MDPLIAYISRQALRANLAAVRRRVGANAHICAMVKAEAYGHGLSLVAPELADAGADFLAVARLEEAVAIRQLRVDRPILLCEPVVAPGNDRRLRERIEAMCWLTQLRPTVADAGGAEALAAAAERLNARVPVHVKIDSGMGRSGALPEQAETVARRIESSPSLVLEGVYTHLATADDEDETFARRQLECFGVLLADWHRRGRRPRYVHAANSAAAARFDVDSLTLVRPGIALYGYHSNPDRPEGWKLSPAMRLSANLLFVKDLPAGHPVGYGCTWRASRPSRIGLVPVGYGDGYSRSFGNRGLMQVDGHDVPVVGRISMDLTTVDLTGLPGSGRSVRPGDEVVIISERAEAANSVENLARLDRTIPYEITCLIGTRAKRKLIDSFESLDQGKRNLDLSAAIHSG